MRDILIVNGKVWTGDPANPRSDVVAISGNRVFLVGAEAAAAIGMEDRGGSLDPSKLADVTIVYADPDATGPERIGALAT